MNGITAELNDKKITNVYLGQMHAINNSSSSQTPEQIAKQLGVKTPTVYDILHALETPISLDYVNGDDKDLQNHELIPDGSELFTRGFERNRIIERLDQLIEEALTEEQKIVIRLRMGFNCEPLTFIQIGEKIGLSHQGAQHRYNVALKRLREYIKTKYRDIDLECLQLFDNEIPAAHSKKVS